MAISRHDTIPFRWPHIGLFPLKINPASQLAVTFSAIQLRDGEICRNGQSSLHTPNVWERPGFGWSSGLSNRSVLSDPRCYVATGAQISHLLSITRQWSESGIPRSWCVPYSTWVEWLGSADAGHSHDKRKIRLPTRCLDGLLENGNGSHSVAIPPQ